MSECLDKPFPDDKSTWYSWIPTNIGYLNFHYIADEKNLTSVFGENSFKLDWDNTAVKKKITLFNTNLSDINAILQKIFKIEEIFAKAEVSFTNNQVKNTALNRNQPSDITGTCRIYYENEAISLLSINSSFKIERSGKISIYDISLSHASEVEIEGFEADDNLLNTIVNALYTIIKKIVHGDNHHFQKIDTLIGVYTEFIPEQILTDLGFQIKRLDKFVKNNENDSIAVLYNTDKLNAHNVAEGFMSYIDTFNTLFIEDSTKSQAQAEAKKVGTSITEGDIDISPYYIKYDNIKHTVKSIYAGVNKFKLIKEAEKGKLIFIISGSVINSVSTPNCS